MPAGVRGTRFGANGLREAGAMHMPSGRYFGAPVARAGADALLLVETRYAAGTEIPLHVHERTYLAVILGGAMVERARGGDNDLTRGWLMLNAAGEAHRDRIGPRGARCLNIEVPGAWLRDDEGPACDGLTYAPAGPAIDAVGLLEAELRRPGGPERLAVECAVRRLLDAAGGRAMGSGRRGPRWLRGVEDFVRDHCERPLSTDLIAREFGVHPAHLCRTFVARHGCTLGEFRRRLRAERAMQRIVDGGDRLSRIASESGFADQSHMTRAVAAYYGDPPARLRRRWSAWRETRGANPVQDSAADAV